ncbi:MAG: hypothetical protein MK077_07785 [Phycisphaerales bacterium]|nr:hypothetical protein [Phycisphaerales bacterium]
MIKFASVGSITLTAVVISIGCSKSEWPRRTKLNEQQVRELNQIAAINQHGDQIEAASFRGETWNIGAVEWDSSIMPLISPDGRFIASSIGAAPSNATRLALPGARIPESTAVQIWEILPGQAGVRSIKQLPAPLLLGDSADDEGFLVEAPQNGGARWIGKVDWRTGDLNWLVKDNQVNALASLGASGRLAWCTRPSGSDAFDLAVRFPNGAQFKVPASGSEWLLPEWSKRSNMLYVWRLNPSGLLQLVAMDGESPTTLAGEAKQISIMAGATRFDPFRATANRSNVHGLTPPFVEEIVFYDPANQCMAVWMPTGINSYRTLLLANSSISAAHDHQGNFLLTMPEGLHWQDTSDLRMIVRINHQPLFARRTTDPMRPFLLLDPGQHVVRIRGMRPSKPDPAETNAAAK